ncbi:FtsX-like permease family protein [Paenibacillus daejeonensis]|uniref:FtsX-like permease family protein n=1 Tax=Paenibacillus daejeonensis TaxID=135193 RepID=UPI00037A2817|nr:ABC transporter permease [Paenibacillus daejeonensis]
MSFRQFAFNNVRRNLRAYLAYLLSSAFMVMLFFTYAVFIFHPTIRETDTGPRTAAGLTAASGIVYVFAFFFVLYSISVFLKSRNREFGILTILGTAPAQLNRLIFTENMFVGLVAIAAGLIGGFPLSYAFLGLSARMFGQESLPMYLPVGALLLTTIAFLILFLVVSAATLVFMRRSQVLELLKGSSKPKKEPKVSILFSLFGIALLITGLLALWVRLTPMSILVAAVTGIAGTYFFYSQLSVLFMRRLQRNRSRVWRGVGLLWTSEMAYKLRDNARMLFLITVMTALASMSTGIVLAIDQTNRQMFERSPFAFEYTTYGQSDPETPALIRSVLEEQGVAYTEIEFERLYSQIQLPNGEEYYMQTMAHSVYAAIAEALGLTPVELTNGSALVIHTEERDTSPLMDGDSVGLVHELEESVPVQVQMQERFASLVNPGGLLVLEDEVYAPVLQAMQAEENIGDNHLYYYYVPEWNAGPPDWNAPELKLGELLVERLGGDTYSNDGYLHARGLEYAEMRQATMLFTFVGMFIALLFSLCSASFLYFKLHTELETDARMYKSLSRIGLSIAEMRSAAVRQIAILFFVPVLIAAVQTMVVVRPFLTAIEIEVFFEPVLLASGGFLALQTIYFLIAQWLYVRSLSKVMV